MPTAHCGLPTANSLLFARHSALSFHSALESLPTVLDPLDIIRVLKEIKNEN